MRYFAAAGHAQRQWLWNSSHYSLVAAREQLEGLRYASRRAIRFGAALLAFGTEMDRRRGDDRRTDRYDRRRDERSIDRLRARGYDRPGRGAGGHARHPRDDDRGYARDRRGDERRRRRRSRSRSTSRSRSRHR